MANEGILRNKSYDFALKIVTCVKGIRKNHKEYDLSRQLVRSGTAIGALIREAEFGQSRADFINKLSISLKEANETEYWLHLMKDSGFIQKDEFEILKDECSQLIRMLVSSIKTARSK